MSTRILIREGIETKDGRLIERGATMIEETPLPVPVIRCDGTRVGHILGLDRRGDDVVALVEWDITDPPEALYADLGEVVVGSAAPWPITITRAMVAGAHCGPIEQWAWER